jgi:site-specific DNA-methyltransferase (adenine-specific)
MNRLYYGDNLDVLRKHVKDESVDLCYIDPPFNSKRNYNQIYNNIGKEDLAQAQAFIDTWKWDELAIKGFSEIVENFNGIFTAQTINLILGLKEDLGMGSLLAYLVSITLRVVEIHRVLKSTGSFYLHCDPTASHYLKLVLDSVFCSQGGDFQNEVIWCYGSGGASKRHFSRKHDVIFFYSKSSNYVFNVDLVREPYSSPHKSMTPKKVGDKSYTKMNPLGRIPFDWWTIPILTNSAKERLGYPTQKPEALLEKIIQASTNEGDMVLDAYCGCGTTVSVAQKLNREWIGIDITYQSISLILRRLEDSFGSQVLSQIQISGIPRDIRSAEALATKKDDRTRKEFEKWAVLTYSNNRAIINQKKGADQGIDGTAFFLKPEGGHGRIIFQVKSGSVGPKDIRDLHGTIHREKAELGIFITLKEPTKPMRTEANQCGLYHHEVMGRDYPCVQIITIKDILEGKKRLDVPLSLEVLKSAERKLGGKQLDLSDATSEDSEAQITA